MSVRQVHEKNQQENMKSIDLCYTPF